MARLAVRLSWHALLHCSLDAAGFARFVWPSVFLFVYLLLLPVLRLFSDLPSKKERKKLKTSSNHKYDSELQSADLRAVIRMSGCIILVFTTSRFQLPFFFRVVSSSFLFKLAG